MSKMEPNNMSLRIYLNLTQHKLCVQIPVQLDHEYISCGVIVFLHWLCFFTTEL